MRKKLKLASAAAAAVLATPAFAMVPNLENPLYNPSPGEVYSRTAVGIMYKKVDDTKAQKNKGNDGQSEFPIWLVRQDLGVGITDRLSLNARAGYIYNGDIDRQGMYIGRAGLNYRMFDGSQTDGWIWDVYADANLGGVSRMEGELVINPQTTVAVFHYDNYSSGRWGALAGTRVGKTFDRLTVAGFVEVLRLFGNSNNEISLRTTKANATALIGQLGGIMHVQTECQGGDLDMCTLLGLATATDSIEAELKSTWELSAGLQGLYQIDDRWSVGGSFRYIQRAANGVKSVKTKQPNDAAQGVADNLALEMRDMKDGHDEFLFGLSVANQLTDRVQVALFGEYTFDTAEENSQGGSDFKLELGARVNVRF